MLLLAAGVPIDAELSLGGSGASANASATRAYAQLAPEGPDAVVPADGPSASGRLSPEARASLLTIYPGNQVYSLWGHSALRIHDPVYGIDETYNYGTFVFDELFVFRFMYGLLDYMLTVQDFNRTRVIYRDVERRSIVEQSLDLPPAQLDSLFLFLRTNALPENRIYRYDFLFDNCSTRIRDALERTTTVRFADDVEMGFTFREAVGEYVRHRSFLRAGIDWLFGSGVDRTVRPYEAMFLPVDMMEAFEDASIEIDGEMRPLVTQTDTLFWIEDRAAAPAFFPWATVFAWMLFVGGVLVTWRAFRTNRVVVRAFDVPLLLVVGLAGVLITFLWTVSLHDVTRNNLHVLWSLPTHVVLGIHVLRKRRMLSYLVRRYALAASFLAFAAVAVSPFLPQAFHPALYPLALLVGIRTGWIALWSPRRVFKRG